MRSMKTEAERTRTVLLIMLSIVVLGAVTAMTKSAMFHMSAVGRWDDGHAYKFSYALSLTLVVFLLKVMLIFIHTQKESEDERKVSNSSMDNLSDEGGSWRDSLMAWGLLIAFTFFEMLSGTVASLGLLYGAPTSMFVVFKSSKTIFLAVMSVVILRRKLNLAQWSALVLICVSLGMATVAEGKSGGKKGGGAELNLVGPALLLLSELFHATMLVLQEIAVKNYWSEPLALLSASAVFGVVMTAMAISKTSQVWVTLPDGGSRPASDPIDSVLMCMSNPALGMTMLLHLGAHVSSDVSHIVILKHISALARTLCDAVKLILMWALGKTFWLCGVFPVLAEAWHPGLIGSWLMLPAIAIIIYAMLMFKNACFLPLMVKKQNGQIGIEEEKVREGESVKVGLDDDFYIAMFTSKKKFQSQSRRKDPLKRFATFVESRRRGESAPA